MTRKSGRTGSTSTASSSSPRDSTNNTTTTATTTTTNTHSTNNTSAHKNTSPANKLNKRSSSGALLLNGEATAAAAAMTKAPRVNGVAERTSPIKTHHHNGSVENLLLVENGFHDATTTTSSPKASGSCSRLKRDSTGADDKDIPLASPRLLMLNGGDQSITGNSSHSHQKLSWSPTKSPVLSSHLQPSGTPLYKVIDKSQSYTKSPQLLSPTATARLKSQSPVGSITTTATGMRSPTSITKSPAEEVKSNRRGQGGQPSPAPSPLKTSLTPIKSSSRPNTPAGVGRGGKKRTLRKNELSLLNDEAENFMFPKAKEDVDSDSSDVIIIVKGKKKAKTKGSGGANGEGTSSNVDDQTMALIQREMGEVDAAEVDRLAENGEEQEEEEVDDIPKAVNLLPLKKRFGTAKVAKGTKTTTTTSLPVLKKQKKKAGGKRGARIKVEPLEEAAEELDATVVVQEKELPVAVAVKEAKATKKKPGKGKKGAVVVKVEVVTEEEDQRVLPEASIGKEEEEEEKKVLPVPKKRTKKKETAKERRKREKLERELSLLIKTEPEELLDEVKVEEEEEETYSNLTRIMEAEEVTRFRFAFERVPSMEPWFAAFNRQDEGEERIFEYYGSTKYKKLPYEMGELPPLAQNCCALSHLRGTPTKSPRKGKNAAPTTPGECHAKPTRLFTSARISLKRNKLMEGQPEKQSPATAATATSSTTTASRRSLSAAADQLQILPRRRGRPPLAARRLQEEEEAVARREVSVESDTAVELSAKQKAVVVTKSIVERKRKLLAELEHPRKSPREHASTLAILSCLLQQRQLNSEKGIGGGGGDKGEEQQLANASEEEMSSETVSERRESNCGFEREVEELERKPEEAAPPTAAEETAGEEEEEEAAATTTTDGETTETECVVAKKQRVSTEEMLLLLPMTPPPPPMPTVSRTNTPGIGHPLKRSNSSLSNQSGGGGGGQKKKKKKWRARDSINAQELNREIESLLTDPLNASAESIDSKLLDKSDEFLLPFHECPDFSELVLSVDGEDYKQAFVRKSFAPRRSLKAVVNAGKGILQLDYQLRSTKKRKNRTGWPTNKRRTSAVATQQQQAKKDSLKRSASSCDVQRGGVSDADEEEEEVNPIAADDVDDDKRGNLTIITEPAVASDGEEEHGALLPKVEDPLQRSPILRKLLSPQWRSRSSGQSSLQVQEQGSNNELMPSPKGRGTSSSPNGMRRSGKSARSPVNDLLMECDESQSVSSSVSVIPSDDGGQVFSSDNTTSSPSGGGMRLFKQTTLSRFFNRKGGRRASVTTPVSPAAAATAAGEEETEKENIEAEENESQEGDEEEEEEDGEQLVEESPMEVEAEVDEVEVEEEEAMEVAVEAEEDQAEEEQEQQPIVVVTAAATQSRRKCESKLKNGINMNPIISIKKLNTELSRVKGVGGVGGLVKGAATAVKAKAKPRVNRSSGNASIRSKRQRRRKLV